MAPDEIIAANVAAVRERIARACARCGRDPGDVRLLGVTKTQPPAAVAAAVRAGLPDLGENYAQELVPKAAAVAALGVAPRWHFIGHLQSNKVRQVAPLLSGIQSVDRPSLLEEIGRRFDRPVELFLEVSIAGEAQKSGADPAGLEDLCGRALALPRVRLAGLMCVPPYDDDPEASRPHFAALRGLRDRLRAALRPPGDVLAGLSMGMSHDLEVAIEEGATVVRVGTALFGARHG